MIRPGTDADAPHYIRLVREAWAEYPGVVFDLHGELPELLHLATHFAERGGALWLSDDAHGMIATRPLRDEDQGWEICRVYLDKAARGTGLAQRLLAVAEDHARAHGARRLVLWTDTRFLAAHAFYEKAGYVRQGAIRILDDLSNSLEFRYAKPCAGLVVEALDAAAAASAERPLARLLADCVAQGGSVSFRAPLEPARARAFWKGVTTEVAAGARILLVAWLDGALAGTAQLHVAAQENQPRRAELEKLLVAPALQRRGVARALLRRAAQAAAAWGRPLLTLDTRAGTAAEALYRAEGWVETGRIPRCEEDEAGTLRDVVLFHKEAA